MKIRVLSDLHLEFGPLNLEVMEDEKEQICVLAGDIGIASRRSTFNPFLQEMSERFRTVLYIPGNHEYYDSSYTTALKKMADVLLRYPNVNIGNNFSFVTDHTVFICSTLWTDMNKRDPLTMMTCRDRINDFGYIRIGDADQPYRRPFTPTDAVLFHDLSRNFIFSEIDKYKQTKLKIVVVSHHAPSFQSVLEKYRDQKEINGAFASALDEQIIENGPLVWIHGHMHNSLDYMIGDTRVVCNPRGYFNREENEEFSHTFVVEV